MKLLGYDLVKAAAPADVSITELVHSKMICMEYNGMRYVREINYFELSYANPDALNLIKNIIYEGKYVLGISDNDSCNEST